MEICKLDYIINVAFLCNVNKRLLLIFGVIGGINRYILSCFPTRLLKILP